MINFCSHFDSKYLDRALVLYYSMQRHVKDFRWFVLALDDEIKIDMEKFVGKQLIIARLCDLLNSGDERTERLKQIRNERTWQEFIWTLTPFLPSLFVRRYGLSEMIYLDADSYFFSDPKPVLDEMRNADIAIVPHRFPPHRDKSQNGIYNVNWVYFKNTLNAMKCLDEWQTQCLTWCYARSEDGKYADQKYLDAWVEKYQARVVKNVGLNLAPWNQEQYHYAHDQGKLWVIESGHPDLSLGQVRRIDATILYHFHDFDAEHFSRYPLHEMVKQYVYQPYARELAEIRSEFDKP